MSFTTPPTFADGNILSAAQLNILSDNQEYLYGLVTQTNTPFYCQDFGVGYNTSETVTWALRHKTNTFSYEVRTTQGTISAVVIKLNGVTIYTDASAHNHPYTWSGTVDITSHGFTVGTWYALTVTITGDSGSAVNHATVYDLREIA